MMRRWLLWNPARSYTGFDRQTQADFHAIMEMAQPKTPEDVAVLADNFYEFTVVPGLKTPTDYAPTLEESRIHTAVVSAMNEMFSQKTMKSLLKDSILSALTEKGGETSIAAIESRLTELRDQQYHLLQLAAAVGVDSTQYDEELKKVSMEFSALVAKRSDLEKKQQDMEQADARAEQIAAELETVDTGITQFDEVAVRQLVSAVKVLSAEKLLIRFKDGIEIEQII